MTADRSIPINIVFAADANYAMPLAVALCSVAAHCDRSRRLDFYVLQHAIAQPLREKVERSLARSGFPQAEIRWIDAPIDRVANFKLAHKYTSHLTFARLLICELLPQDLQKAIYLDCDVVANDDIAKLWDIDIGSKALGAVTDTARWVSEPGGIANYEELGIPADWVYFNAGVLVFNLEKWRRENIGEKVLDYLSAYRAIIQMADQEALNAVLWDDWRELDYRWNWQILQKDFRSGRLKPRWSPEPTQQSIVHFTTGEKPWLPGARYDERTLFFDNLRHTEWADFKVPPIAELKERGRTALTLLWRAVRSSMPTH